MFNGSQHYSKSFNVPRALMDMSPADKLLYDRRCDEYKHRYLWGASLDKLWELCLVHSSKAVPGKVEYFSSLENMRNNRLTRTSPEMFLERWLVHAPPTIRISWEAEVLGRLLPTVKFATTKAEWIEIYERGPESCMAGREIVGYYCHPENNLQLAYEQNEEDYIPHRAIVNTKSMAYARIYGDDADVFSAALRKLGYHASSSETLHGEKIHVSFGTCVNCEADITIGPYLDCDPRRVRVLQEGKSEAILGCGETVLRYDDEDGYVCSEC